MTVAWLAVFGAFAEKTTEQAGHGNLFSAYTPAGSDLWSLIVVLVVSIFGKLGLVPSEDDNRRVLAVLAYLNA